IANQLEEEAFPTDEGLTALLVFHRDNKINDDDRVNITELSEWLASEDKPEYIASALPFHQFPEEVQDQMFSEDETTLLFNVALVDDLDSSQTNETLEAISEEIESIGIGELQFEITGPAGISEIGRAHV